MRQRYLGILNLVVIVFYLLRPSLPYLEYIINKDYIAKHLCIQKDNPENSCNGKCYLHEQLKKQSEPPDAEKNDDSKIVPDKKIDDHLQASQNTPGLIRNETTLPFFYSVPATTGFIIQIFVPPKN